MSIGRPIPKGMARARFSIAFEDLRGAVGRRVLIRTAAGPAMRGKPTYRYPKNPDVLAGNSRFVQAGAAWNDLSLAEVEAWRAYASTVIRTDEVTGQRYHPTPKNAFVGLAVKFLQITPEGSIPRLPPMGEFVPDALSVSISPVPGGVLFTATGSNSEDVSTELLFQRLKNIRCQPGKVYKSLAFHAFGGEPLAISLEPGAYGFAYRFVRPTTGQATPYSRIGVLEITG